MIGSLVLFAVLFVIIWLMHKPFNVHESKPALKRYHELLEYALIMQFMIILNMLLARWR